MTVRTRFAPSPTGHLHIGGVRTALFNWLYARKHNGEYLLRIEDTDRQRSLDEFTEDILSGLSWLGIESDTKPVHQSSRMQRYREVIEQLLDTGKAYHCYCSRERLELLRHEQIRLGQKPRYDGHCRTRTHTGKPGIDPVVRLKTPLEGSVQVEDRVCGTVETQNSELDDLVLARSDGTPTYHLCVVVDDIDSAITHVIRGNDHLNNTPRQINIFKALGQPVPDYAHIPLIHGKDGKRLSKRHGATSVIQYQKDGFLPAALANYLVRLGWSHGDQEIFAIDEMIELFSLSSVHPSPAIFDMEKLLWVNHQYLKRASGKELRDELEACFRSRGVPPDAPPELPALFDVQKERCKTLQEICEASEYFYCDIKGYDEKGVGRHFSGEGIKILEVLGNRLQQAGAWTAEDIKAVLNSVAQEMDLKFGQVAPPLRLAVTGQVQSPSIDITLELLGAEKVVKRIDQAIEYIKGLR
ncbi:MAG: glutamate--tRNA ligase [Proteobacteria bacterium]|nr:glutamate--tRNA ligase [Pseudomonadota bacterium]